MVIIYDGECPFCADYSRRLRLVAAVGEVIMIDARSGDPRLLPFWDAGYDLDQGMIVSYAGQTFHGADAVALLGPLSAPEDLFNRINRLVMGNVRRARFLYPGLKAARRIALWIKRVGHIERQS